MSYIFFSVLSFPFLLLKKGGGADSSFLEMCILNRVSELISGFL